MSEILDELPKSVLDKAFRGELVDYEAEARAESREQTTDECTAELETAKNAICRAHGTLFDVEVDRAYRELSDAVEADE